MSHSVDPSRPSLLIVDDDVVCRLVICEVLIDAGFVCAEAADGVEAVTALERGDFRMVLVDLLMPNKDGVETIVELRRRWPHIRVLAMTGGSRALDPQQLLHMAKALGADTTLFKPFGQHKLLAAVEVALAAPR